MIDRTPYFWTGDSPDDIDEWLAEYTEKSDLKIKQVRCHHCGSEEFKVRVDQDEGAIQVTCASCGKKKILLDGEEYWEDCSPRAKKCPVCKKGLFNIRVGFDYRENGDVKWVYIGNRCTACGTLGSFVDWPVDYGPTNEMENNI